MKLLKRLRGAKIPDPLYRWQITSSFKKIPPVPGCYAFYRWRKLYYIGSSVNMRQRIWGHANSGRIDKPTHIKFKPTRRYGEWLMVEARLLRRLHPTANIKGVGPMHAVPRKNLDAVEAESEQRRRWAEWQS